MPTDRPTPVEILQAIDGFLQNKVAPQVDAHSQFHLKVTRNLLGLLQREWQQQDGFRSAELQRLRALLDEDTDDLGVLNNELCDAIRNGTLQLNNPRLKEHLQATAREKLAIDNPRYLGNR